MQKDRGHFAHDEPQHPCWYGEEQRPIKRACNCLLEARMRCRFGRDGVHGSAPPVGVDCAHDQAQQVVARDPAHPLASVSEDGAEAEAGRQGHHGKRAAVALKHKTDAQANDAGADGRRALRSTLPRVAKFGRKTLTAPCALCKNVVIAVAVEANGRAADENARRMLEGLHPCDEFFRAGHA